MRKILIVSPIECFPTYYGNSARIASFVHFFQEKGIDFRYLHLPDRSFDPAPMEEALGGRYIYEAYRIRKGVVNRLRLRAVVSKLLLKKNRLIKVDDFVQSSDIMQYKQVLHDYQPDTVLINYAYLSKLLAYTPSSMLKIIDTHDSLHLRYKSIYNSSKAIHRFRIGIDDEINALNRADKVVCIQKEEHTFFKDHGCKADLYTIGHHLPYRATNIRESRAKLLYVGAGYTANLDAVTYFLNEIWPLVSKQHPNAELYIAGGISKELKALDQQYPSMKILGYVDDLYPLYDTVDVAINPVRMGSGMKIKNIEALSFGKPIITTSVGGEGLGDFKGNGMIVVDSVADWLSSINRLLSDTAYYQSAVKQIEGVVGKYNIANRQAMERLLNR